MKAKQKKVEPNPSEFENFGDYLARVIMHPQTPATLKSALQAVVVNIMSNETGYSWADDEAGLSFLVPLFLSHMRRLRDRHRPRHQRGDRGLTAGNFEAGDKGRAHALIVNGDAGQ
jgi:hypothetical protein